MKSTHITCHIIYRSFVTLQHTARPTPKASWRPAVPTAAHCRISAFSHFVLICLTLLTKTIAVLIATFIYCVCTAVRQPYCSPLLSTLRSAPYLNITMANPRFMHLSTYGVGYTWSSAGGTEAITGFCGKIEGRWRRGTEKGSGRSSHTSSAVQQR
jgi:hypothetical protein